MTPADYWRQVCAPKLRARKAEIGREMTNTQIAAAVEARSGKSTTRQLIEHFFRGKREPYVSQLVAICEVMKVDLDLLIGLPTRTRQPLIQGVHSAQKITKRQKITRSGIAR